MVWYINLRKLNRLLHQQNFYRRYHKDTVNLVTVCSCHVTYACQSESILYSCLNAKELLARNRHEIWSLSDCNCTRTQNHLVHKRTLNHLAKLTSLAKWLSVRLRTKWLWVRAQLQSSKSSIRSSKGRYRRSFHKYWLSQ